MRRALWCWACLSVLYFGCGDDAKNPAQSAGAAGDGSQPVAGENAGGENANASHAGSMNATSGGPSAEGGSAGSPVFGPALAPYENGTRLRAVSQGSADAKQWLGWHDSELDIDCTFRLAEDGEMRCLTLASVSGYADADCQVPIVYAVNDCDPPEIVTQGSGSCGDEQVSYSVGAVVTPAKTYFPSAGGCEEATFGGTGVIYSVEKLPAAMFMAAEERLDPRDGVLSMSYLEAEDGALQPLTPNDVAAQRACSGTTREPYANRCVPAHTAIASASTHFYADAECSTVIAHDPTCREKPLDAVTMLTLDECNSVLQFAYTEIGDKVDALRQGYGNDQCVAASGFFSRFYEIGDEIPPATLPELATVDLGAGRVKARYFANAGGEPLTFSTFYDSELELACSANNTALGLRCLPPGPILQFFGDDQCSQLLVFVTPPLQNCVEAEPVPYAQVIDPVAGAQCTYQETPLRVFKTGAKIAAPTDVYGWYSGECLPQNVDLGAQIVYEAAEVPASDFAPISRETE